jgi:ubiquinone/menaquinone biosynthesis C-methylase UbiE
MIYSKEEKIARDYYNSIDADNFYYHVWGGEDIHIGLYNSVGDPTIESASQKTIEKMISLLNINSNSKILDIGSGYGGSARFLVNQFNCHIDCLNISEEQNNRNRSKNIDLGLNKNIDVIDGSFENIPLDSNSYDVVWSQDAILHSSDKNKVFTEVSRVLKNNGTFIFTDPMQRKDVLPHEIQSVLDRIHLNNMGSFELYESIGIKNHLKLIEKIDLTKNLFFHYSSVLNKLIVENDKLLNLNISNSYLDKMKTGLIHWIDAAQSDNLKWGILKFQKNESYTQSLR